MTGGTGGLGLAVSSAFADAGYRTIVTWVVDREAEQAERALGDRVEPRKLDVTDPGDAGVLAAELDGGSGCWALVHLVGGYLGDRPLGEMTTDEWHRQLDLNATSAAVMMGAFLPGMAAAAAGGLSPSRAGPPWCCSPAAARTRPARPRSSPWCRPPPTRSSTTGSR